MLFTFRCTRVPSQKTMIGVLKNCRLAAISVDATISLTIHRRAFVGCCRRRRAGHRSTGDRRKTAVFLFHGSHYGKCHCRANNAPSFIPSRLTHLSATSTTGRRTQFYYKQYCRYQPYVTVVTSGDEIM